MHKLLTLVGSLIGWVGVIVCLIAGLARVSGLFYLSGYQSTTVFGVGVALMVFACLAKLEALSMQQKPN
jgi:hypothetical protein